MPVGDRELVNPPPSLASLQELSGPALIAMLVTSALAVLDGLVIAERLAQEAVNRQGGEPRDDIAILVLHRRGG